MFYADLHVHSKYSRATSRDCDLEHLALAALRKGISVVATGDFTHPAWLAEIEDRLIPAEPGLFRLRPELERQVRRALEVASPGQVRFMLQVEVSTIYKKAGRTRKVHHVVYVPGLDEARRLHAALGRIGNLASDGRPILGLDSRNLLEIVLSMGPGAFLVPAHIWTPWFAVLGSNSGFDSVEECYGDLAQELFAVETGLSSDPEMNWRLSSLDRFVLVSNSDAHSPGKLGREACMFDCPLDYFAMVAALRTGRGYAGTVEFFPEEGKYHFDGHRKCGVCLSPDQTRDNGGLCPACGKPVVRGVMHRVMELADRPAAPESLPPKARPYRSLIPLEEVLAEVCGVGPGSQTVQRHYAELLGRLGPELAILQSLPLEDVQGHGPALLTEALRRMRQGQVIRQAGYDGQYGVIRLFSPEELRHDTAVPVLFPMAEPPPARAELATGMETRGPTLVGGPPKQPSRSPTARGAKEPDGSEEQGRPGPLATGSTTGSEPLAAMRRIAAQAILDQLDPQQRAAAEAVEGPVLIVAGPGTGKTRTLTHRLAHLVANCSVPPQACLALTFSRRAAEEMRERLGRLVPDYAAQIPVMTFHAFGLDLVMKHAAVLGLPAGVRLASEEERVGLLASLLAASPAAARQLLARLSRAKRAAVGSDPVDVTLPATRKAQVSAGELAGYQRQLAERGWLDFEDLVLLSVRLLADHPEVRDQLRKQYRWVSIDEYQDLDAGQYRLVKLLVPPEGNLCAIGDPDQAIYGFRGADVAFFQRFREDFPTVRIFHLSRNYRSTQTIVDAALQVMTPASLVAGRCLEAQGDGPEQIEVHACPTEHAEAEFVLHTIERMLGGASFYGLDSGRAAGDEAQGLGLADFAVLYRTEAQAEPLVRCLGRAGLPFQRCCHEPLASRPWVQTLIEAMARPGGPTGSVARRLDWAAAEMGKEAAAMAGRLRPIALRCGEDIGRFLSELNLATEADLYDPRADRIALMTIHAAKGLEFPVVFLVGCEDGVMPLHWGRPEPSALAEERRLFFVAMTRAAKHLFLSYARQRLWRGQVRKQTPSPFLADIQERLLARHAAQSSRKRSGARQRLLFD